MKQKKTTVTLEDVAAATGYSRALISIVMRNAPGATEKTREIVRAKANELGYRPDIRARALASTDSRIIGVVFGVAGSFHLKLLDGLYAAAEKHRYTLVLSAVTPERNETKAVSGLLDFRLAGLIMLGPAKKQPIFAGQLPIAVVGWQVSQPTVDTIRTSDDSGMHLAVGHLAGLGHKSIAHIDGGSGLIAAARRESYKKAMKAAGLGEYIQVISGGEDSIDGQKAADIVLQLATRPTAIIAYNDDVAIAASTHFKYAGLSVPKDISVIGWDDSEASARSEIPLTSVRQEPEQLAELAFERVLARIEKPGREFEAIVLEPTLVIRESSGKNKSNSRNI
jgi:DNA-binding LacI/PurR family transcriptional regulator